MEKNFIFNVAVCTCQSQTPNLSLPSTLSPWSPEVHSLSLWICFHFANKCNCIISFQIPHISDIKWHLSLSDLLYSVWQSPGPSMLLPTLFFLFNGWVIFHCVYGPHLLYPFICWWTFRLLPCLCYCKQCYSEYQDACILLNHVLLWVCAQEWDCWIIWKLYF